MGGDDAVEREAERSPTNPHRTEGGEAGEIAEDVMGYLTWQRTRGKRESFE